MMKTNVSAALDLFDTSPFKLVLIKISRSLL